MTKITWDQVGQRVYETGVDQGVLYIPNGAGVYDHGYGWNGLTAVTESPSGAESNKQYADNQVYVNLLSYEEFGATIEAFTYPEQFAQCDGTYTPQPGVAVGQQPRKTFGLCYRTRVGNDLLNTDYGYKLHMIWGALAAPSEKAYSTINDSPEALNFSWDLSTTPVPVGTVGGHLYKPTSYLCIDSTKVDATALAALENLLYGTVGTDPSLPTPAAVLGMFAGTLTLVPVVTAPTYVSGTHTLTIPSTTGVIYMIGPDVVPAGDIVISQDTVVTAVPAPGYKFPDVTDDDWFFDYV